MKNRFLFPCIILLALYSCIERQNFDQYDDLEIIPTVEASILYIESPERLLNEIPGQDFYSQDFNFDGFSVDAFSDRVLDGFVFYEIENTTSKEMEATVEFLDEGGNTLDTQYFHIDPAPTPLVQLQVAYVRNLGDNSSVSNLPDPKIIFRSSGQFRLRLK